CEKCGSFSSRMPSHECPATNGQSECPVTRSARMNHRFFARTAITIAATAIASLGVAATSAQAATGSPHASPRFMCDSFAPAVCVFQHANFSGNPAIPFQTSVYSEEWVNLTANGLSLPWGSFNNDSGSSVVFGDAQTGSEECFLPGTRISEPAN